MSSEEYKRKYKDGDKVFVTVEFPKMLNKELRIAAANLGISKGELVRRIIRDFLEGKKDAV